nr:receptor like protein 27-like [Ziziphus jujuba var. spinosa]
MLLLLFLKLISLSYEIVITESDHDHYSFTSSQPATCHDDEKSALLQFRDSFLINKSASGYEGAYPKVLQWNNPQEGETSNCCSWDGVECDEETGNVIGLDLSSSCLYGSINSTSTIFRLVHLRRLNLSDNHFNYSQIPASIGQFSGMTHLDLSASAFSGQGEFPAKIFQLPNLQILIIGSNSNLNGYLPEFLRSSLLKILRVGNTRFSGSIPSSIQNLESLEFLIASQCNFSGPIPSSLGNLTQLVELSLHRNKFHGSIPQWLSKLNNLKFLSLSDNNLGGSLKFDMFFNMKSLSGLQIGHNNLSLLFEKANKNATLAKFNLVGLGSCNLIEFPDFLRHQNKLETLLIADNMIRGPPLIPPPSIKKFMAGGNMLEGEISPLYCNLTSLDVLSLSHNMLSGTIPRCLENSTSLSLLDLRDNYFHGIIPEICKNGGNLEMIDLSYNQLQGHLPRLLSNCKMLQVLAVSNNQLNDVFPSWLGSLPELRLLTLRCNWFHSAIGKPENDMQFPKLQVIDLSSNNFTGELPSGYIFTWNSMKAINVNSTDVTFMNSELDYNVSGTSSWLLLYPYGITITFKEVERYYTFIHDRFAAIDFSCNRFEGEIPILIGNLKALHSINLSNNMLTGYIPSSLENLKDLDSLDISRNFLSGTIPQQLSQLSFLSIFNVSQNNLIGPIPQGNQFNTFDNTSFEGNPGLCGALLSKKCDNSKLLPPPASAFEKDDGDSVSQLKLDWKFVLAGYISGLVVGIVLSDFVIMRRYGRLVKIKRRRRRRRRRDRRN